MDLLLYQLNISGLTVTTVMIALFFAAMRRSIRRSEMRWWMYGWLANVAALTITSAFWYFQPPAPFFGAIFALYLAAKLAYVWLLSRGALDFCGRRPRVMDAATMIPVIIAVCVPCVVLLTTRDRLGLVAQAAIALGFGAGAAAVWRTGASAASWLAMAFATRALLAGAEAGAYAVNVAAGNNFVEAAFSVPASRILAAHFALGTGAEWLLAMGMVIAVSARAQRDLQNANAQMVSAQTDLRRLVDRDPLTGLANRRALPEVFRAVQPDGALLIFFDLNDFKRINDERGHQAGDECLKRFATALTHCFRPNDAVIRYGGDEFLVVAAGVSETAAHERTEAVRSRVGIGSGGGLPIRFSVGISHLPAGGDPDDALREADEAMYRGKRRRPSSRARVKPAVAPQLPFS